MVSHAISPKAMSVHKSADRGAKCGMTSPRCWRRWKKQPLLPVLYALVIEIEPELERNTLTLVVTALREAATRLAGDAVWSGAAGRAAADLIAVWR